MDTVITFYSNIPGNSSIFTSVGNDAPVVVNETPSTIGWTYQDHQFLYWCDTQDGSGETQIYVPSSGPYTSLSENTTLYAIWERTTPAINKVEYGDTTLIDLTSDTVEPSNLLKGTTAHDRSGELIEGVFETYTKAEIDALLDDKEDVGVCIQNGSSEDVLLGGKLALSSENSFLMTSICYVSIKVKTTEATASGHCVIPSFVGWTPICVCGFYAGSSWCFFSRCVLDYDPVSGYNVYYGIRYIGTQTSTQTYSANFVILYIRTALPTT